MQPGAESWKFFPEEIWTRYWGTDALPLLQRIRFPETLSLEPLYFRTEGEYLLTSGGYTFGKGSTCILDTFYNACFIGRGGWPNSIGEVSCRLSLLGDFDVSIVVSSLDGKTRVLKKRSCLGCSPESFHIFSIPNFPKETGRIYPVLSALSHGSTLSSGYYECENPPAGNVHLGIVICTFRREKAVLNNLRRIAGDRLLEDVPVWLIDNGKTISPEMLPENCRLISNENSGGAGGFSRGLLALLDESDCSHALLMDDDIQLDTESIFRSKRFFEYTGFRAITGALLSPRDPCRLYEAGADLHETHPLRVVARLSGTDFTESEGLSAWQRWTGGHYGGFWFFGFPLECIWDVGLLLPFFFKADDIEFGLRLTAHGIPIDIQAGVGVHHPGFSDFDLVKRYYWVRNMLVVRILQDFSPWLAIKGLLSEAIKELRSGRTGFLIALSCGTEDFLKGPSWLEAADDQLLIKSIKTVQAEKPQNFWLFMRAVMAVLRYIFSYRSLRRQWRLMALEYVSIEYWKRRFQLNQTGATNL